MTPLSSLRYALSGGDVRVRFLSGFRHILRPGRSCEMHAHPDVELVYHPTGNGATRIAGGSWTEFGPGAVVVYPPGQRHEQTLETAGADLCLHVAFPRLAPAVAGILTMVQDLALRRDFESLAGALASEDPMHRAALDHRVTALLCGLSAEPPETDDRAAMARDLIARDYAMIRRIPDVARRLGIGEDHLRHLFTARYGMGPGQYLLNVRIDRARDLLARSRMPLADVAEACGFRGVHHLSEAFSRVTGCAPVRWRRRYAVAPRPPVV